MLANDIEQKKARRFVTALGAFWAAIAVAATAVLVGDLLVFLTVFFAVFVLALFLNIYIFWTIYRMGSFHSLIAVVRLIVAMVRATGWNPKRAGALLVTPLVVFIGAIAWLSITGGPDYSEEDLPFGNGGSPAGAEVRASVENA